MLYVPFVRVFALWVRTGVFEAARKIEGSALELPPKGGALGEPCILGEVSSRSSGPGRIGRWPPRGDGHASNDEQ